MQLTNSPSSDRAPGRAADRRPTAGTTVLAVEDLEVVLGATTALTGATTTVRQGEAVALMGANGSGKSTMLRAILNLVPHKGSVELFGTPHPRFRDWHRIGFVPQHSDPALQRASVREVVSTGRLARRRPFAMVGRSERRLVTELIARVGLQGREGWEMSELSGGQQQRARIARALATEPDLLVLDEPLVGLDLPSQRGLADLLRELKEQGLAMLVVLHELGPLGALMDRALVLDHGHLVHDGRVPSKDDQARLLATGELSLHADCREHVHGHDHHHEHDTEATEITSGPGLVDNPWIGERS
ncbi:metal ABC transporter ATP-binding protein [Granulicoccus sp. GXG6511]|uniref:metal ABC transporter ATP-binding protein n=1 Tax=Granulicoccus sp. GXG6511 TaxID=3381351 RepID=UPI003D7C9CA8